MSGVPSGETAYHRERERALSFGSVAEMYDAARPSYPRELIDDLMALQPLRVLDVGCGTGRAARLLQQRGCTVTGVEPDRRMAGVARKHGVHVEESSFEEWDPGGRSFDLLVSGQAWHWVDPAAGPRKAADVLRPGGHIALFWNLGAHDDSARDRLIPVYERLAPAIAATTTALACRERSDLVSLQQLSAEPRLADFELRTYAWDMTYSRDDWLAFLATHSDHVRLAAAERAALLQAVGDTIDALGGSLCFHYQTVLILGRCRGSV